MIYLLIILLVIIIVLIAFGIRIVPESYTYVVERLGRYYNVLNPGFHVIIPLVDKVRRRVLLKEQVADFAPQPVITKDNVTMQIDSVVYFKVMEARLYTYG
ncbi:MAG: peptidase, partial [Erysipelotrichaceae bacterium]|nr:peptidase [Erysipelotrichaceae bacterium]